MQRAIPGAFPARHSLTRSRYRNDPRGSAVHALVEHLPALASPRTRPRRQSLDTDFENAKKLVEETIKKLGLDPVTCRAPSTDAQSAWTL
jgi:hypothetical protein